MFQVLVVAILSSVIQSGRTAHHEPVRLDSSVTNFFNIPPPSSGNQRPQQVFQPPQQAFQPPQQTFQTPQQAFQPPQQAFQPPQQAFLPPQAQQDFQQPMAPPVTTRQPSLPMIQIIEPSPLSSNSPSPPTQTPKQVTVQPSPVAQPSNSPQPAFNQATVAGILPSFPVQAPAVPPSNVACQPGFQFLHVK